MDRVVQAEILPWEPGCVGISLEWESGRISAYFVHDIDEAQREMERLNVDPHCRHLVYENNRDEHSHH